MISYELDDRIPIQTQLGKSKKKLLGYVDVPVVSLRLGNKEKTGILFRLFNVPHWSITGPLKKLFHKKEAEGVPFPKVKLNTELKTIRKIKPKELMETKTAMMPKIKFKYIGAMDGGEKPLKLYNLITKEHPRVGGTFSPEGMKPLLRETSQLRKLGFVKIALSPELLYRAMKGAMEKAYTPGLQLQKYRPWTKLEDALFYPVLKSIDKHRDLKYRFHKLEQAFKFSDVGTKRLFKEINELK